MPALKQQFITDETGNPVAVILPLEDYNRVRGILEAKQSDEEKLRLIKESATDEAFLNDLQKTMRDFTSIDANWWEPAE